MYPCRLHMRGKLLLTIITKSFNLASLAIGYDEIVLSKNLSSNDDSAKTANLPLTNIHEH